jgi:hypothetical protein
MDGRSGQRRKGAYLGRLGRRREPLASQESELPGRRSGTRPLRFLGPAARHSLSRIEVRPLFVP